MRGGVLHKQKDHKGGRLAAITYPNGDREIYRYDKNGNLIRRENQNGDFLTFTYDCMDRMVKISEAQVAAEELHKKINKIVFL